MRLTLADLKDTFLAACRRMINTQVVSEEMIDNKKVATTRNYAGGTEERHIQQMREEAGKADMNVSSIAPGNVYFTDDEVVMFLNMAWEKLHTSKCEAIKGAILDPNHSPGVIEAMIYDHDQLYQSEKVIFEFKIAGRLFSTDHVIRSGQNGLIFQITDNMQLWGPPTIVSVILMEYPKQWTGNVEPLVSKVCKLVGLHEIAGFINLATNSRYSSGALYIHRKTFIANRSYDILEVFHKRESEAGNFEGCAIAVTYIRYPKPLAVSGMDRIIEVAYGYEIAHEAAVLAMSQLKQ